MRTLGELHNQLAYIIGDPIRLIQSDPIPDGVRFSKVLRESYLQRAFDEVLGLYVQQLSGQPANIVSAIATRLFPLMLTTRKFSSTKISEPSDSRGEYRIQAITEANLRVGLWLTAVYNATELDDPPGLIDYVTLPLPIHNVLETNGLINSRSNQFPDPFFRQQQFQAPSGQWLSDLYLHDYTNEIQDDKTITLTYLEYVPLLSTLNWDSIVKFEDMLIGMVYQKAAEFAKIDSQEKDYQQPQGE